MIENKTISRQLFERILDQIKNGELKAGDKLKPERVLVEEYEVSRSSVREAIGALNKMGIVVTRQGKNRGNYINDKAPDMLTKVLEIYMILDDNLAIDFLRLRKEIEKKAAYLAAINATQIELENMKILHQQRSKIANIDQEELYRLDRELHLTIAKASHNKAFELFIEAVFGVFKAHQAKIGNIREIADKYHSQIIGAIENREAEQAEAYMENHIEHLIEVMQKNDDEEK